MPYSICAVLENIRLSLKLFSFSVFKGFFNVLSVKKCSKRRGENNESFMVTVDKTQFVIIVEKRFWSDIESFSDVRPVCKKDFDFVLHEE